MRRWDRTGVLEHVGLHDDEGASNSSRPEKTATDAADVQTAEITRMKQAEKGQKPPGTMALFTDILRKASLRHSHQAWNMQSDQRAQSSQEGVKGVMKGANAVAIRQCTNWGSRYVPALVQQHSDRADPMRRMGFARLAEDSIRKTKGKSANASLTGGEKVASSVIGGALGCWNHVRPSDRGEETGRLRRVVQPIEVVRVEMQSMAKGSANRPAKLTILNTFGFIYKGRSPVSRRLHWFGTETDGLRRQRHQGPVQGRRPAPVPFGLADGVLCQPGRLGQADSQGPQMSVHLSAEMGGDGCRVSGRMAETGRTEADGDAGRRRKATCTTILKPGYQRTSRATRSRGYLYAGVKATERRERRRTCLKVFVQRRCSASRAPGKCIKHLRPARWSLHRHASPPSRHQP